MPIIVVSSIPCDEDFDGKSIRVAISEEIKHEIDQTPELQVESDRISVICPSGTGEPDKMWSSLYKVFWRNQKCQKPFVLEFSSILRT